MLKLYDLPVLVYRLGLGRMLGTRFLLLEHRGRRSGRSRETVLEVVRHDPVSDGCIVASGFGEGSHWLRNLEADPRCHYRLGRRRLAATARRLPRDEAERELADYVRRHPRAARAVVRAVGLDLDPATPEGLRRFAAEVPLVALDPR